MYIEVSKTSARILGLLLLVFSSWLLAAGESDARLAAAAQRQDRTALRALLRQKADVNGTLPDGTTALHWAAHWNDLETVRLLLSAGARPTIASRYGITPLWEAITVGNNEMTSLLVDKGGDPKATLQEGETLLMTAARVGNVEIIKSLAARGVDVNAQERWQGTTALMFAAMENHSVAIKALVELGANPNLAGLRNPIPRTPQRGGKTQPDLLDGGITPLMIAARQGHIASAQQLIAGGANVNYVDPGGFTPLMVAVFNGHFEVAVRLLDAGANPDDGSLYLVADIRNLSTDGAIGLRPLPKMNEAIGSIEMAKRLMAKGANPNGVIKTKLPARSAGFTDTRTLPNATPLQRAARNADVEMMRVLLEGGASPDAGMTSALMTAIQGGRGTLAFRTATAADTETAVKLLIEKGANVNAADDQGNTALHIAAQRGADTLVRLLAAAGATLDAKNRAGRTPLDFAMGLGGGGGRGGAPEAPPQPSESTVKLLQELMSSRQNIL